MKKLCVTLLAVLLLGTTAFSQTAPWPTKSWTKSTFSAQGSDATPIDALHKKLEAREFGLIDRMVVIRNGYLLANHTYKNDYRKISKGASSALGCGEGACDDESQINDYNYLHPDIHPYYRGRNVHSLQSTTKSVSSAILGVAVTQGLIRDTNYPMLLFFEGYDLSKIEGRLKRATLADLLTMRSGIEWHEQDRPLDETNTTLQLERSNDWIQFTLNQPMDADPGTKWAYSSGGSHLMSGIVKNATGEFIDTYAEKHFFGPMGIEDYHWKKTPKGYPDTEGGLFLEALDLAKVGLLFQRDGVWDGQRILSSEWVKESVAIQASNVNNQGWGYGYQWWRLDRKDTEVWATLGFGENYMIVLPEYDVIGVVNGWNLFGHRGSVLYAFVDALIDSAKK